MTHPVLKSNVFFQTWPFKTLVFHWFNVKRRSRNWSQNTTVVNSESGGLELSQISGEEFFIVFDVFFLKKAEPPKKRGMSQKGTFWQKKMSGIFFVETMFFFTFIFFSCILLVKFKQGFDKIHFTWSHILLDQTTTSTTFWKKKGPYQNDVHKQTPRGGNFAPKPKQPRPWMKRIAPPGSSVFFFQNGLS